MDMLTYIQAVQDFDPNKLDDDLSSLGKSTVPANPVTPTKDTGEASALTHNAAAARAKRARS